MIRLGKTVILGDSYSTFENYIPQGYAQWYLREYPEERKAETDVNRVEQTWWYPLFQEADAELVLNCSYSGSTICNTGYSGKDCSKTSFVGRLDQLIAENFFEKNEIETLIVFGGTNDSWAEAPIGELKYADWSKEDLFCVLPATAYLFQRIRDRLPGVRVLCIINTELKQEITDGIKTVCDRHEVERIELENIDKIVGHPNIRGMQSIRQQVTAYLEKTK